MTQARLLGVLRDREPTINEIARLLELDKSSISGLVDRAEARGLVRRVRSPRDGRSVRVALTRDGRRLVRAVSATFEADVVSLLDLLPGSDRDSLRSLVSRLLVAHASTRGLNLFASVPPDESATFFRENADA